MAELIRLLLLPFLLPSAPASPDFDPGPGWEEVARDGTRVVVYRKTIEGSPVLAYKGMAQIDAPVAKVMGVIRDIERRPEWANRVVEARVLAQNSPDDRVEYVRTQVPWPLQDRDFVYRAQVRYDRKARSVTVDIRSVELESMPPRDGLVRGLIHDGSFTLAPSGNGTRITAQAHAEPRGNIPTWVVNLVQKAFPRKTLRGLSLQVDKPDVKPDAKTLELFRSPGK